MIKYSIGMLTDKEQDGNEELNILVTINSNDRLDYNETEKLKEVVLALLVQYTKAEIVMFERDDTPDSVLIEPEEKWVTYCPPLRVRKS